MALGKIKTDIQKRDANDEPRTNGSYALAGACSAGQRVSGFEGRLAGACPVAGLRLLGRLWLRSC